MSPSDQDTKAPSVPDAVNHPSHYTAGTGYRLGNVLKYLWRHAAKGGVESLKKARWYLDREIAVAEKAAGRR